MSSVDSSEPADAADLDAGLSLTDRRIAFHGKLGSMSRKEAKTLVKKHGGVVAEKPDSSVHIVVVGADQLSIDQHEDLLDESLLEAASNGQIEIISETQLWQRLGMVEPDLEVGRLYTPAMLAQLLDLPISTIRRWHRRGLISPTRQVHKLPYFDFQEVASARRLAKLIASGAAPHQIESRLSKLAGLYPDLQRPLSQLSVIVEGRHVLLRQEEGLLEPGGQMRIDFDSLADAAEDSSQSLEKIDGSPNLLSIDASTTGEEQRQTDGLATPDDFVQLAIEQEDAGEPELAIQTYRSLALAFGSTADVCFRIAELLYQQGDLAGARERYFVAIEMDESFVEARANLGCVLVESGDLEMAISAFAGALMHHSDYPDAHFYLARVLDQVGRPQDAVVHWQQFLDLAPKSPWAEEAMTRLEEVRS
jgi:tetratricopeptide (TPR) repeat protein